MDKERALKLVQAQNVSLASMTYAKVNPAFDKWYRDTRIVLEKIFGADSSQVKDFRSIDFWPGISTNDELRQLRLDTEGFDRGISGAKSFLHSVISEIEQFWDDPAGAAVASTDPLVVVLKVCGRFHHAARQLRDRHDSRTTIEVEDEYDVQDLLHGLLKIDFDDIRPEEWTPSYAGQAARMDFLLKDCQIVLEAKKTRSGLADKEVGNQLLVDIARYKSHPDCKTLVCFIYDPEGRIGNPTGLENDLSGDRDGLKVVAVVNPK